MNLARDIHVSGIVQGVGFRPFVFSLARRLGLTGWVLNTSAGVDIHVEGGEEQIRAFVERLRIDKPPLAVIDKLILQDAADQNKTSFEILASAVVEGAFQPVSPDSAICPDCERELFDPSNRRYLFPFINCTNCGPRFTIILDLPYDRPATTMAAFTMCPACKKEYLDPLDRRFHAQPTACPVCGPFVQLRSNSGGTSSISSIDLRLAAVLKARQLLRDGKILAIKGLGGFHLACDASNERAVNELRRRKGRAGKPFALMFSSLAGIERVCEVNGTERSLLAGREKPIVLLKTRSPQMIAPSVAPGMDSLGVMLPYTPLHHLLLNQSDKTLNAQRAPAVLVMTSGNLSDEPIAIHNEDALERLAPLADAFLMHNREIHIRCDDSVLRADGDGPALHIRRSRSYAPYPVSLPFEVQPLLATGGELKNTFCMARENYAFLSQHIGDMENAEVYESFERNIEHLSRLFRVEPQAVAHDLHPGYFTTRWAQEHSRALIAVQHHHAHIAACMADNGLANRMVIGLSFDGTGHGTDGASWGGETLIASYAGFERFAQLEYLPLPGGDAATRSPWRIAAGYTEALGLSIDGLPFLDQVEPHVLEVTRQQVRKKINTPLTSSMGRLFDAAAALMGVRAKVSYEAQAAIELEVLSRPYIRNAQPYDFQLQDGQVRTADLLAQLITDIRGGAPAGLTGARFHRTAADIALQCALSARTETKINEVVLSGGVWQNQVLLDLARASLQAANFIVYTHRQTPANDGGLSLGQAAIAGYQ